MPINYAQSKIYKIVCNITGETYYGATTQPLSKRLAGHRAYKYTNKKISSTPIIERGNYDIVLCEEVCCDNKEQLYAIERKWIEENDCVNKQMPIRYDYENKNEIYTYNKKYNQEAQKKWRELNRDKCNESAKKWRENNKEYERDYNKKKYIKRKEKQLKENQHKEIISV
jgi:hypothetical protein